MMKIEFAPKALDDLEKLGEYLIENYGVRKKNEILKGIIEDVKTLAAFPHSGSKELFHRFGIDTGYAYLVTNGNYAFFRVEGDKVKIIRVLDTRRDAIYILFGIKIVDDVDE